MDAHANEYAAAAAAMNETYGRPLDLPAIGDFVNGCTAGRRWSGYVLSAEPGRLAVDVDGAQLEVDPSDVTRA